MEDKEFDPAKEFEIKSEKAKCLLKELNGKNHSEAIEILTIALNTLKNDSIVNF